MATKSSKVPPAPPAKAAPAQPVKRPFAVTLLAILAGVAAVLAALHALQAIGILPYMLGPAKVHSVNVWSFLMWLLMVYIWVWLIRLLWKVDPQAWMFMVVVATFDLIIAFMSLVGDATFSELSLSFIANGLILIYCMLPSTKAAFGIPEKR